MPDLLSAALFARDEMVLTAHRKDARAPFGGQWVLPLAVVGNHETAEDAVRRHARETFGIEVGEEQFVDTVYLEDPADQRRYVANIFRSEMGASPMRFNAAGDYDDARWLGVADIEQLWMPPALRAPVVRVLRGETIEPSVDWERQLEPEATPLAERAEEAPAPDNRAGWDAISRAYQGAYYGDRAPGRLRWARGVFEDELHVLDDVRNRRALVLGCGGGQDCLALDRMGALVVGLDTSAEQLAFARKYAERHGAANASFVEGDMQDLSRFDDAGFDLVLSIRAIDYTEDLDRAVHEAARVLKPAGSFVIAVPHPLNEMVSHAPYVIERSYWDETSDFEWAIGDTSARLRQHTPTLSSWYALLTGAGLVVERIVEPNQGSVEDDVDAEWDGERARLLPSTLILKARKR
jgi:SAM-dependent methyltransferase/ADP-ribose pyrophosphatase YjhB (NUDIX family)